MAGVGKTGEWGGQNDCWVSKGCSSTGILYCFEDFKKLSAVLSVVHR
jgi:hypothetical protein